MDKSRKPAEETAIYWTRNAREGVPSDILTPLGREIESRVFAEPFEVVKLGVSSDGRASPLLWLATKAVLGEPASLWDGDMGTDTRFFSGGGEVLTRRGPGVGYQVLFPTLDEVANGSSMTELVSAINSSPAKSFSAWAIVRNASFTVSEFGDVRSHDKTFESYQSDPMRFWLERGVSLSAVELARPGGPLLFDMNEATTAAKWILLGAKL